MNLRKNKNGITLIALIITIIVLLILAGISITTLTGNNGILNRATNAREVNDKASAKEELDLAIQGIKADFYAEGIMGKSVQDYLFENVDKLKNELGESNILVNSEAKTIAYKGKSFTIDANGNTAITAGLALNKNSLSLKITSKEANPTDTLIAKLDNVTGTVNWISSNEEVATVDSTGKVTAVAVGTSEITATCGTYTAKCGVKVTTVAKINSIILDKTTEDCVVEGTTIITATVNEETEEETEEVVWESSDETKATVSADSSNQKKGIVTGLDGGTVTITAKNPSGSVSATCTVTIIKTERISVKDIINNKEKYYGQKVINYSAGEAVYRIFYVDDSEDNYFGDGKNTIYLKADYCDATELPRISYSKITDRVKEIMKNQNKLWAEKRLNKTWNYNEESTAWLCDPNNFEEKYKDKTGELTEKINYVIGAPGVEMYVKSYNDVPHKINPYTLKISYKNTEVLGYYYALEGKSAYSNNHTGMSTLDYKGYNSMYSGTKGEEKGGYWWLASPCTDDKYNLCNCVVSCVTSALSAYHMKASIMPLVSLKSDSILKVEVR